MKTEKQEEPSMVFYRPVKKTLHVRLDADVLAWLKKDGRGYQARANRLLREKMLEDKAS